jgi:hypothetical protein
LADPFVTVFAGQTPVAICDNWKDSPSRDDVIDNGLQPTKDLEAAMILALAPGEYTVVLSGAHGATGNGLIAVWNLE